MTTLQSTLWVSLISIVLLFASMAVIWGMMALLAKIPDGKPAGEDTVDLEEEQPASPAGLSTGLDDRNKKHAAAVAVVLALALRTPATTLTPNQENSASPWQIASRTNRLGQTRQVYSRKGRGSAK